MDYYMIPQKIKVFSFNIRDPETDTLQRSGNYRTKDHAELHRTKAIGQGYTCSCTNCEWLPSERKIVWEEE